MEYFLVLIASSIAALAVYFWESRPSTVAWVLVRSLGKNSVGVYKRKKTKIRGKFETSYTTYAVLKGQVPNKVHDWSWKTNDFHEGKVKLEKGLDLQLPLNTVKELDEIGFAKSLGAYSVYINEEDHLDYNARADYAIALHAATKQKYQEWSDEPAYKMRQWLDKFLTPLLGFFAVGWVGIMLVFLMSSSTAVEMEELYGWLLIFAVIAGFVTLIVTLLISRMHAMLLGNLGRSLSFVLLIVCSVMPVSLLAINNSKFTTICSGSVPVERSWSYEKNATGTYYADITLPSECLYNTNKTSISKSLYDELQGGRTIVDVVVLQGRLGFKRLVVSGA